MCCYRKPGNLSSTRVSTLTAQTWILWRLGPVSSWLAGGPAAVWCQGSKFKQECSITGSGGGVDWQTGKTNRLGSNPSALRDCWGQGLRPIWLQRTSMNTHHRRLILYRSVLFFLSSSLFMQNDLRWPRNNVKNISFFFLSFFFASVRYVTAERVECNSTR